MTVAYAVMLALAVALLTGYCVLVRPKEKWLLLLYICVPVIMLGYFLLSVSSSVGFALFANKIAYLGSVFLSMCMFMTIIKLCGFHPPKQVPIALLLVGVVMLGIVCTTGYLPWYYKEVSLEIVDGATKLHKEYGPLHSVYLIYLVSYFVAMIVAIVLAVKQGRTGSPKHAALLSAVVGGNIIVWFVEKFVPWNFEFLAVSYIISELVLLFLYWMMQDYVHISAVPKPEPPVEKRVVVDVATMPMEERIAIVLSVLPEGVLLHTREREILEAILQDKKRKDIAADLNLSENTVKTYTRNLYSKLNVSCREDLFRLLLQR